MLANTFFFPFLSAGALFPGGLGDDIILARGPQPCDDALKYKCAAICERVSWSLISSEGEKKKIT